MLSEITCDGKTSNQPTEPNGGPDGEEESEGKEYGFLFSSILGIYFFKEEFCNLC